MKSLTERIPRDLLKWTAAGFALVATATAEYEIARAIGMNEWIAAAVPGALDAYVVRALRTHREVLTSVVAMVGVNAASHLVTAGILPVEWPLITAVSAIAPLVLWRVHALGTPGRWRRRTLWGVPKDLHVPGTDEHTGEPVVHASTDDEHTEHGRSPDNPEPPGTREHPEHRAGTPFVPEGGMPYLCSYGCTVWGDVEAHERAHEHMDSVREHIASTLDLDVPDWVNPPSTPPVPVHAPYVDHVLIPSTPSTRHLSVVPDEFDPVHGVEHAPDPVCPACKHDAHTALACDSAFCDCVHHLPEPEHMERARELFHTIGGVPPFRALKHGTPGMGTDRAKRIRAALKIENKGTD